jgi:hypothetical protein
LGDGAKVCETPLGIQEVGLFLGNSQDVKGWVTKIQFQRGRLKGTDASSTIPPDSFLGII